MCYLTQIIFLVFFMMGLRPYTCRGNTHKALTFKIIKRLETAYLSNSWDSRSSLKVLKLVIKNNL